MIDEHNFIINLETDLRKGQLSLFDIDTAVLENNLYGVDINEESVEIAKLSLWLKTAKKGRKLTDLSEHIKCGNSLIDDPEIAGEKAFDWNKEFPKIMQNGGFDVVIGNPPYVQSHSICDSEKNYIYKNYITAEYQINTYGIFVEKFISLLKDNSFYSLIIPNYWLSTKYDKLLRKEVFINNRAIEIINTFEVFESATVDTLILTGIKSNKKMNQTNIYSISNSYKTIEQRLNAINLRIWDFSETRHFRSDADDVKISFAKKFNLNGDYILKDFFAMHQGMKPYEKGKGNPTQTREMMISKVYHSKIKTDETHLPLLGAKHIKRHYLMPFDEYIKYGKNLAAPRKPEIFKGERILINRILSKKTIDGILLSETYINNTDVFNLIAKSKKTISIKVLYALIVSKLCATYFKKANVNLNRNAFPKINVNTLETFPIPKISKSKQKIIEDLVDSIVNKTSKLYSLKSKFLGLLKDNFGFEKLTRKLSNFNLFEFKEIVSELKKQKIKISLSEQSEWKDFFESNKNEINQLQEEINSTDKEIDKMIYDLYGLTNEEIEIVERG
ncbi:Eco57I restriction-modification methylase domain-containing protein [bacterium]|nr:Eco57I restriction-modification methylase domain-containing protein [bacterium]